MSLSISISCIHSGLKFSIVISTVFSIFVPADSSDVISISVFLSSFSGNSYPSGACISVKIYFPGSRFSIILPSASVVTTLMFSPFISSTSPTNSPFPFLTSFPSSSVIVNFAFASNSPFSPCLITFNVGVFFIVQLISFPSCFSSSNFPSSISNS